MEAEHEEESPRLPVASIRAMPRVLIYFVDAKVRVISIATIRVDTKGANFIYSPYHIE